MALPGSLRTRDSGPQSAPSSVFSAARGRRLGGLARRALAHGLAWRRLPAWLELVTIGLGYGVYTLIRDGLATSRHAAFAHAAQVWRAERRLHINIEPYLNHLVAAHSVLADATGYYYGLLHFIVTPLVLAWLFFRHPEVLPRLRSALVVTTVIAMVTYWSWPLAPPRLAVPGMSDVLVNRDILGAANPHGVSGLVDLYAAMPSLHIAWATWCATAVVMATASRWRYLAWLYPAATAFVVLASANHYVLDVVAGAAAMVAGLLVARGFQGARRARPGPAVATRDASRRPGHRPRLSAPAR